VALDLAIVNELCRSMTYRDIIVFDHASNSAAKHPETKNWRF
jgi:hypothetical protein